MQVLTNKYPAWQTSVIYNIGICIMLKIKSVSSSDIYYFLKI